MYPVAPTQNGTQLPPQFAAPAPTQPGLGLVPQQQWQAPMVQQPVQQVAQQYQIPQQQLQPQQQPVQPQAPQAPMPLVAPNPNLPQQQAPAAPVQQQQPAVSPYEQVYQNLARSTGQPVETFKAAIKDDPAVMSSMLHEAIVALRQAEATRQQIPVQQQQQHQVQQPTNAKIDIPQAVMGYLKRNNNGLYEAIDPAYQQFAQAANHNQLIDQTRAQQFLNDPTSVFKEPQFQQVMQQQIEKEVQQRMQVQELVSLREQMKAKYAKDIAITDANGQIMYNPQDIGKKPEEQRPLLTPLGNVFNSWTNRLHQRGMKESPELYEAAMMMAKSELGMNAQPQQQQQQMPPGLFGQQKPQQPDLYQLQQQQMNANSFWPGQAPARQQQAPSNMSLEGALMMALQYAPEGGDMNTYFQQFGPRLFN